VKTGRETPGTPPPGAPLLEVRNLRTWFTSEAGTARAVDGVSFHVDPGETLGVVGESGCGKTVTSLSVMGLIPTPPGRIVEGSSLRFRGVELTTLPPREFRKLRGNAMAMIFQEPMTSLNPVYTVGDQIVEALRLHRKLGRREARERGVAALREVGIPEPEQRFDEHPHQLSGGMRQRVMIAMSLACEPDLLIADEPTTALDVTIQAQILDLLAELRTRRGMAMLLITHDLGVVAEVCDRVLVMYAGQVVESGTVEEIFDAPRHPYTRGLLASLPRLEDRGRRLRPIEGTVPSPLAWPGGCRFRARCIHAWERCAAEPPPLFAAGEGVAPDPDASAPPPLRASRCWLEVEPERAAGAGPRPEAVSGPEPARKTPPEAGPTPEVEG
jgi:oligopeptide/dipeptide ABC transporter ATP-binding protein